MMVAVMEHCRVPWGGYTGINHVNRLPTWQYDAMPSYWLAETLKYLFLLFSEDSVLDLGSWVLNTEGHPLRRRTRDPVDVWKAFEAAHGGALPCEVPYVENVARIESSAMRSLRLARESRGVFDEPVRRTGGKQQTSQLDWVIGAESTNQKKKAWA